MKLNLRQPANDREATVSLPKRDGGLAIFLAMSLCVALFRKELT